MSYGIIKSITYDPQTGDFRLELDGQLVGYAATYSEGEHELDALVFERLRRSNDEGYDEVEYEEVDDEEEAVEDEYDARQGLAVGFGMFGLGLAIISAQRPRSLQIGAREVEGMGYRILRSTSFQFAGRWYMILLLRQM